MQPGLSGTQKVVWRLIWLLNCCKEQWWNTRLDCRKKNCSSTRTATSSADNTTMMNCFLALSLLFAVHQLSFITSYETALLDYFQPVTIHLIVSIAFCLHCLAVYSPSLIYSRSSNQAKTHTSVLINLSWQPRSFSVLYSLRIKENKPTHFCCYVLRYRSVLSLLLASLCLSEHIRSIHHFAIIDHSDKTLKEGGGGKKKLQLNHCILGGKKALKTSRK